MNKLILQNAVFHGEKRNLLFEKREDGFFLYDENCTENPGEETQIVNLNGKTVSPGFIDLHVHLRDPGFTEKETVASGTCAARKGGFYGVCPMPNTSPVADCPEIIDYVIKEAKKAGSCRVFPIAAITKGLSGKELTDFDALANAGAVGFSDDGRPVQDCGVMREAMKKCAERGYRIFSHSEELSLTKNKTVINESIAKKLGFEGVPASAEVIGILKDITLAEETGCSLHICHVSTAQSVQAIKEAKSRGVKVTSETCPHYFSFTENDLERLGTSGKMNPPLRHDGDRAAIIDGIKDGTIDCISTDHAPHTQEEKAKGLRDAPCGIIGLESSFSASYTALCKTGIISFEKLLDMMIYNPARIINIDVSGLKNASEMILIDREEKYIFGEENIYSKSKNSPFIDSVFTGRAYNLEDFLEEKRNEF